MILPRRKHVHVTSAVTATQAVIDQPADTIMIAEITDHVGALNDSSPTGGAAIKSHRPTNAISNNGAVFDGETGNPAGPFFALTFQQAAAAINFAVANNNAGGQHHIAYISPDRHSGGANYIYADGHVKWARLEQTLNPAHFQWGKQGYTIPGIPPILDPVSGQPVR